MKYQSILRNWKVRLLLGVVAGVLLKILVDVIFGLIYRNQPLNQRIADFIPIVITAVLILQFAYWLSLRLDKRLDWNKHTKKRYIVQSVYLQLMLFMAFGPVRWAIEYQFYGIRFTVVRDELIILFVNAFVGVLLVSTELGVFLLYKWRFSFAQLERFKKENAEFKFETLQNQVNPHFLFNSLNTLSSVMYENVDTAADYIRQLSLVYRYVLENRNQETIELQKELDFLSSYKYLFELRFKDRLSINIEVQEDIKHWKIAPMTIQLLIENAVKHNVINKNNPLFIKVYIANQKLIVENNLQKKVSESYSSGLGLKNIENRYAFLSKKPVVVKEIGKAFIVEVPLLNPETVY